MSAMQDRDRTCGLDCCWLCGAQDGDYDDFEEQYATLFFMEAVDSRLPAQAGYQVKCDSCAVGGLECVGVERRLRRVCVNTS